MKYPKQTLNHYDAFIFDFDGTLVPCLDLRAMKEQVLDFTIQQTGIERSAIAHMMMVEFIDHTQTWLAKKGSPEHPYYEKAHELVRDIEIEAAANTSLFPGTLELLTWLKSRGIKIGIVTRNCEQAIRLMSPGIDLFCDALIARDHAEYLKPDARHLQQCLTHLEVKAANSLMVGDGIVDIQLAKALNVDSVAVLGGHNSEAELMEANPTWLVGHVNELENFLTK